tara:strand:- start:11248 stop:12246 length:999 start_codon:yes stop_codon:yes gene_type:complete
MDFSNFRISDGSPLKSWSLFFLKLGFFLSHYASQPREGRLTVTVTVPGAEFASAFIAIGANIKAITSDNDLKEEGSPSSMINLNNLIGGDEVMMVFKRKNKPSKGFFKRKLRNEKGERMYQFGESSGPANDDRFELILEKDIPKRIFPKGTSEDLINLSPLLKVCCKNTNFNSMLLKNECVTTLLGVKSLAFEESQENLFYSDNEMLVGGCFNDLARFQNDTKEVTGYYSRIFSNFKGASIEKFIKEMNEQKTRLLLLTSKSLNSIPLGTKTNEKVRINLLDRSKNIISLQDSLQKINRERQALGGKNLDPNNFLNFKIPCSMEVATQIIHI